MPNMERLISGSNRAKLKPKIPANKTCSCRESPCPLGGKCNISDIVYSATVTDSEGENSTYIGMTADKFRLRYNKHTQSLRNPKYKNQTKLSRKVWELREEGREGVGPFFKIHKESKSYEPGMRVCNLCLDEKASIILFHCENSSLLNSRMEMYSTCRHKSKYKLEKIWKGRVT